MKKILIVEDEYPVRDVLKIALSENGYMVYEAENGKKGVQMFIDCVPDIVLTDVKMPGISGIEVTKRIKEKQADADVVIMTGYGSEELVIEAIRAGATNYLKKPVSFDELFNILDHIIFKRENRKRFKVIKDGVIYEKKTVTLNNEIEKVWGIVNQVLYNIPAFLGERTIEGLKLGLYEILVNAIEHGNLGITAEEKEKSLKNNSYSDLLTSRLNMAREKKKIVTIHSLFEGKKLTIEIIDQGGGFNHKERRSLSDSETIMGIHGRGIVLTSLYYDKLEFKDTGNIVILEKNL
ncbi:MAG TPA: response regulator [Spirochaetes bacterium]|nr:response regulator [Spirochaetota bacterium]